MLIVLLLFVVGFFTVRPKERPKSQDRTAISAADEAVIPLEITGYSFTTNEYDERTLYANINRAITDDEVSKGKGKWLQLKYEVVMRDGKEYKNGVNIDMIYSFGNPYNSKDDKHIRVKSSDSGYVRDDFKYSNDETFRQDNLKSIKLELYQYDIHSDPILITSYELDHSKPGEDTD